MAVVKLTSSGKAILFIDDEGRVYSTSLSFLSQLTKGLLAQPFVLLSRLPFDIHDKRFKASPVYDPDGILDKTTKATSQVGDGLSPVRTEKEKLRKNLKDKKVW